MREKMRPAAVWGIAALLLVAGCGRDADGNAQGPGETVSQGKATGDLTIWAMGTEGEKLSVLAEDFMTENPDANVTVTPIPWDGAHDKISTAIAAGETPDLSLIGTTWMGEFARTGGLDPTPADLVHAEDFFPGAWDTTVVDQTSFGVPWYVETRLIYVNREVADKAGITAAPQNWADFKAALEAMQGKGGATWGASMPPGGTGSWQTAMPFLWQNGADIVEGEEFAFDSPEAVEALEYYRSFFSDGLVQTDQPDGTLEPDFIKGDIGAFISGPWHMSILKDQDGAESFDLWPMPTETTGTSFIGGGNLAVFTDAPNRDAAWKFVQYVSRPDVQVKWYQTAAALPSVTGAWEDPVLSSDPQLAAFGEQLNDAKSPPTVPTWEQVAAVFDSELEKLVKTDITAAEAAQAMQDEATSIGMGS